MLSALSVFVGTVLSAVRWLAVPIAALLFLQWPLREWVQAYSREANDLGQILFALFVAVSVTAATRAHVHIAADVLARRYRPATRRTIAITGFLFGVLPWVIFVLWSSAPLIWQSLGYRERFPETANPGYFVIKASLWLLAVLMLIEGLRAIAPNRASASPKPPQMPSEPTT
jgi:TRAP-type mannitol/chloroaromatic compound transport system permease small subunit